MPLIFLIALVTLPYLKHILTPLDYDAINNKIVDGVTIQSAQSTCGPSSLASILRTVGIEKTEQEIARSCYTTATGTEVWNIKKYLKDIGVRSEYVIDEELMPQWPAIAGVMMGDMYGHFVAVLDKKGGQYIIADPLTGKKVIAEKDVKRELNFTGFYLKIHFE